jgi:hypothetical protein
MPIQALKDRVRERLTTSCTDPLVFVMLDWIANDDLLAACARVGMVKEGRAELTTHKEVVAGAVRILEDACRLK